MTIITIDRLGSNRREQGAARSSRRKVVSIDEYRGVVVLPLRQAPQHISRNSESGSEPLSAA